MITSKSQIPGYFCSDPEVQQFCEREAMDFNPYCDLASRKTARGLIDAAIARFGHWRCYDIEFFQH
jgi:hypothetical protein